MGKTNVERPHAWLALADAEHCRLLCCRPTEQGMQHVDEHETLDNTFPEHEHLRPQTGDGMTHDVEEKERRFAGQILGWLQKQVGAYKIGRLVILATPRMLGVLRRARARLPDGPLLGIEDNLMRLEAGQLAEHPMVRGLFGTTDER